MTDIDALIDRLAEDGVIPPQGAARRFALPLLAAMILCVLGVALVLDGAFASVGANGIGPITVKWGFSIAVLLLSVGALIVLGKPGRSARWAIGALAVPFIPVVALLGLELAMIGPVIEAPTWRRCLTAMLVMSPLGFAGAVLAVRALAPTDLRRAGLVAGLFGGAVAMTAYAPFCPELGMLFMATLYCLPMLAMAAIGWLTGPKLLRW
ncbi:MAG: DUF1109 domain-containing protein [Erythrobacter sp.]|nr:MAG: DUF1109 domain-containing protein [Erythrobacter sp.]